MKSLLLPLLLCLSLTACKSGDDPAPVAADPLVGRWQADQERIVIYSKTGAVSRDNTNTVTNYLEATATALTFSAPGTGTTTSTYTFPYTRSGEALTVTGVSSSTVKVLARSLTASTFTYETTTTRADGTVGVSSLPFHR